MFPCSKKYGMRVGDMSFFVFYKFESVIFKIVHVMTGNLPFAFLYVLSIVLQVNTSMVRKNQQTAQSEILTFKWFTYNTAFITYSRTFR